MERDAQAHLSPTQSVAGNTTYWKKIKGFSKGADGRPRRPPYKDKTRRAESKRKSGFSQEAQITRHSPFSQISRTRGKACEDPRISVASVALPAFGARRLKLALHHFVSSLWSAWPKFFGAATLVSS